MISIKLNGKEKTIESDLTLTALLHKLALDPAAVVIEQNQNIIKRDNWMGAKINPGDVIEIINFVGGG
jgi:sulfur carrier protein